jgi:NADPH-dependent 2,4-dienoyl-CoA reductase/sulfur reductase-like enzyme
MAELRGVGVGQPGFVHHVGQAVEGVPFDDAADDLQEVLMTDVLVIGAGMAGVAAARELARAGFSVSVVEGRDRIGGRVYSVRDFCAEPVEGGADFVHGVGAATWPDVRAARLAVRPCPLMRHTMFNVGAGTRWLPWILLHPGTWRSFDILHAI